MTLIDGGGSTAGKANVDADFNMKATGPTSQAFAGFAATSHELDAGLVLGSRTMLAPETNATFRQRVGIEQTLFNLCFEGTNIARDRLQQNDTTATSAQATGYLTLNSGGSVTVSQGTNIRTYRTFTVFGGMPIYAQFQLRHGNPTATNAVSEWGFGYCSGVTAQMTDGAIFRMISGGTLQGVLVSSVSGAGVDTSTVAITTTNVPSRDGVGSFDFTEPNDYLVEVNEGVVRWWINDTLVLSTKTPANGPLPFLACDQPIMARVYNTGAASAARSLGLGMVAATQGDMNTNKMHGHAMCGLGGGAYQIQPGTASGPTVTRGTGATGWPTSATARVAGTWTATTAPALNSLGGSWTSPAMSTLTTEADYPVFSYQNPAGTATLPGKTLYITGVRVGETVVTVVAAVNTMTLSYAIGVGGTSSATTQTEAATVVASRIIPAGQVAFTAAAAPGTSAAGFDIPGLEQAPLVVYPGQFLCFIVRPQGTVATNTLVVMGMVTFIGYHE